ncbi:MAG TPA: flagellar motor protein MotA [Azospirillaceae bacterium]|nr:flagellar motor protein MotA [Azospirillaceae bacterium]
MTRPELYLTRMLAFLAAVAGVAGLLFNALESAFATNPALNGLILAALLLGILYILRQVLLLRREVRWLEAYQNNQPAPEPNLLGPMARMLAGRKGRLTLSALSMRSLLDGIAARLDEQRELSRYLIGLLIFLGLLGTFWGLLHTVRSVGEVLSALPSSPGEDLPSVFAALQKGLGAPLVGMGTAFSSSLFGLAGSLVLGFLELQSTQAQHRFFQDVEDWLSGQARLSGSGGGLETGDQSIPAYVQALLEQTAENLDALRHTVETAEDGRRLASANLTALAERLGALTDQMQAGQQVMLRLAEGQSEMRQALTRLGETRRGDGFDDSAKAHLRNIDLHLGRLVEEGAMGRSQAVQEIRNEIKILTRTIAAMADDAEPR